MNKRKAENRARILAVLEEHGPMPVVHMRHKTGLSESAIRHHLAELDAQGRIGTMPFKAPSGRGRAFFLKEPSED